MLKFRDTARLHDVGLSSDESFSVERLVAPASSYASVSPSMSAIWDGEERSGHFHSVDRSKSTMKGGERPARSWRPSRWQATITTHTQSTIGGLSCEVASRPEVLVTHP
jgi:hypothetical protein